MLIDWENASLGLYLIIIFWTIIYGIISYYLLSWIFTLLYVGIKKTLSIFIKNKFWLFAISSILLLFIGTSILYFLSYDYYTGENLLINSKNSISHHLLEMNTSVSAFIQLTYACSVLFALNLKHN